MKPETQKVYISYILYKYIWKKNIIIKKTFQIIIYTSRLYIIYLVNKVEMRNEYN